MGSAEPPAGGTPDQRHSDGRARPAPGIGGPPANIDSAIEVGAELAPPVPQRLAEGEPVGDRIVVDADLVEQV